MTAPDLSIVIVNWNTCGLLRACLDSVFTHRESMDLEVFVVDNASADGSVDMVRESYPQVRLIVNAENVGFARANNQAFPLCTAPYVLLLNSDTIVRPGALAALLRFIEAHPEAGAVAPKIVHPAMRLRVLSCGYQPTARTLFNQYFFLSTLFPHWHFFHGINLIMGVHDDQPRRVEWLSGACILVRSSVIRQVGPLSEHWFMYAEDLEWCQRMLDGGWALYHLPDAVIEHHLGASADQNKEVSTMWVSSQREYYIRRAHPSPLRLYFFDRVSIAGLWLRAAIYALRGRVDGSRRPMWRAEHQKFVSYARAAAKAASRGSTG